MHKPSYYTVATPKIESKSGNKRIMFSTRSSQAIVVNEDIYENFNQNKLGDLSEDIFAQLVEKQFIVPEAENEIQSIIGENKATIADERMLYEVIQPSAMCQLGCDYCGQEHIKLNTPSHVSQKMIARIRKKLETGKGKYKALRIGWFGGEPLMALQEIRLLTAEFQKMAKEFEIGYGAKVVTNGLSLKEGIFVEAATKLSVDHFEITLDGTAEFHDKRRHTKEGHGTFDLIFNNLLKICNREDYKEMKCTISVRVNVDKRNFEGVSPLIKLLAENKLQDKLSNFYFASVYSWGNDAHLKSFTKEEFAQLEIDWTIEKFENGFESYLLPGRVKSVCLAVSPVSDMYDAFGNIFNCTEVSYVPIYKETGYVLGNLKNDESTHSKVRPHQQWNDQILANEFQCHSCRMLPVCGGGCPKQWTEGRVACPTSKFNIQEKLILSYMHAEKGIKELSSLVEIGKVQPA
jgi:uncharacterized protein